jgi:hypothetical protein
MNSLHRHCTFVLVIVLGDDHVACEIQVHALEKKMQGVSQQFYTLHFPTLNRHMLISIRAVNCETVLYSAANFLTVLFQP